MSSDRVRVFKRMETDEELRARACGFYLPASLREAELDDYLWRYFRTQRRIIEEMR